MAVSQSIMRQTSWGKPWSDLGNRAGGERVLLDQADLQTVSRYEAHLSRQMYQALHELEALQTRRGGKAAPLARLDVQS